MKRNIKRSDFRESEIQKAYFVFLLSLLALVLWMACDSSVIHDRGQVVQKWDFGWLCSKGR